MTEDTHISNYKHGSIYLSSYTLDYYWENAFGVIVGEGLDSIDDCKSDIDADQEYSDKKLG